jgi:hypothetical protein
VCEPCLDCGGCSPLRGRGAAGSQAHRITPRLSFTHPAQHSTHSTHTHSLLNKRYHEYYRIKVFCTSFEMYFHRKFKEGNSFFNFHEKQTIIVPKAVGLTRRLSIKIASVADPHLLDADPKPAFTMMRVQILSFNLMRIRIRILQLAFSQIWNLH